MYTKCSRPTEIGVSVLDKTTHIGSAKNVAAILKNRNELVMYSIQQDNALDCYEARAEKGAKK